MTSTKIVDGAVTAADINSSTVPTRRSPPGCVPAGRRFTVLLIGSSCAAGEAQASNAQVDVISTK